MSKAFQAFQSGVESKGFQVRFANGHTVSVMFGGGNYCEHRNLSYGQAPAGGSENAEFAVLDLFEDGAFEFDDDGECIVPNPDTGWKSPEQVAAGMALVATWPADISKADAVRQLHECFAKSEAS